MGFSVFGGGVEDRAGLPLVAKMRAVLAIKRQFVVCGLDPKRFAHGIPHRFFSMLKLSAPPRHCRRDSLPKTSIIPPMIRVTVKKDGQLIQRKDVSGAEVIFGREREADIQLFCPAVSRRHARLQRGNSGWQIADLGAANGVYVVRPGKEPQRVVIEDVAEGDSILIEAFTVSFEITDDVDDSFAADDFLMNEDSLETKRTQFISMQDVLAGADLEKMRAEGTELPEGLLKHAERASASAAEAPAPTAKAAPASQSTIQPKVTTSTPQPSETSTWWAKMESADGHRRQFELQGANVSVGTSPKCDIVLPSGPPVLLTANRASGNVTLQRVPRWPFPRIKVDGNVVKEAILGDGDHFMVGNIEVAFFFEEPDRS